MGQKNHVFVSFNSRDLVNTQNPKESTFCFDQSQCSIAARRWITHRICKHLILDVINNSFGSKKKLKNFEAAKAAKGFYEVVEGDPLTGQRLPSMLFKSLRYMMNSSAFAIGVLF